jgi:hypothetical protein
MTTTSPSKIAWPLIVKALAILAKRFVQSWPLRVKTLTTPRAQMNRAQALRLKSLAEDAYQPQQYQPDLTSQEATRRIEALKAEIALADSF